MYLSLSLQPTQPDRGWVVMPIGKNPWWMYLASFVPALLVTILIFMDQQITAVIVNRKENKLKVQYSKSHSHSLIQIGEVLYLWVKYELKPVFLYLMQ